MATNIGPSPLVQGQVSFTTAQEIIISQSDDSIKVYGSDGGTNRAIKTDAAGELQIDVLTSALPSGASTEARQATANASLASMENNLNNLVDGTISDIAQDTTVQDIVDILNDESVRAAGDYAVGLDEFEKKNLTADYVSTDTLGNPVYALAVRDYSAGVASTESSSISGTEIFIPGILNKAKSIYITVSGTWSGAIALAADLGVTAAIKVRAVGSSTELTSITANGLYIIEEGVADSLSMTGATVTGTADIVVFGTLVTAGGHSWQAGNWNVSVNNTSGGSAVNIQDGGNTITVDGTVSANATLSAETTKVIGTVNISAAQTVATKTALTPASPATYSLTASTAQALASNSSRKGLVVVNVSSNVVSLGLGANAVLNSGITLYPGGTWSMDEYTFCTGAINAIASVASGVLGIQEFT